jgi:hypothetical protein
LLLAILFLTAKILLPLKKKILFLEAQIFCIECFALSLKNSIVINLIFEGYSDVIPRPDYASVHLWLDETIPFKKGIKVNLDF